MTLFSLLSCPHRHLGLEILRQGDFHIGNGFYMNDYIMGFDID